MTNRMVVDRMLLDIEDEVRQSVREMNEYARKSILLPVDAERATWYIGDMAKSLVHPLDKAKKVCGTGVLNGRPVIFYASTIMSDEELHDSERHTGWDYADEMRHYNKPTVEDVLRDYASRILIAGCIDEEDELVAEYAAKLRVVCDE